MRDIQGIDWTSLPISRETFRETRIETYSNFMNCATSEQLETIAYTKRRPIQQYYHFKSSNSSKKCILTHFQLRHLVASPLEKHLFYAHTNSINKYSELTGEHTIFMKTNPSRITALGANKNVVIAGGLMGECIIQSIHHQANIEPTIISLSNDVNGIINHLGISSLRSGVDMAYLSSNDQFLRLIDLQNNTILNSFHFDISINCSGISPNRKMFSVAADSKDVFLIDSSTGTILHSLKGHLDFSFATEFSPCGTYIVTGNQDKTSRIYDIRKLTSSIHTLQGNMCAIRSTHFSPDGSFLALAEAADFVHLFDFKKLVSVNSSKPIECQTIDFFGEIAGLSFSPYDGSILYIANSDEKYGSFLEFTRNWRHLNPFTFN